MGEEKPADEAPKNGDEGLSESFGEKEARVKLAPPTALIKAVVSLGQLPPNPAPRFWIAFRAGLSISLPIAIFTLFGYENIGLQAAAGGFMALFYAGLPTIERVKVLPFVGAGVLGSAALGAALAPWPVLMSIGLVLVAVLTATLCFAYRIGPPGPMFFVMSYGLASSVTRVVDGERLNSPWVLIAAVAGGLLLSYLLALFPLVHKGARAIPARSLRELLPRPWLDRPEYLLILRIAIIAAIGTLVTVLWVDPQRAYWTVASGVAVVGLSAVRRHSLGRGLHRIIGTVVGAGLYLLLAPASSSPWLLILALASLQFLIELVVVRNYALALVFATPLVLLLSSVGVGGQHAFATAGERFIDTVIGTAIAVITAVFHEKSRKADT